MFEGTKVRNSLYFKFTVKPDLTEIWKGIIGYQMRFHKPPEFAWYHEKDREIGELLKRTRIKFVGIGDSLDCMVPEGQIWFYVPGGFVEVGE